jgi:hypothetical protein
MPSLRTPPWLPAIAPALLAGAHLTGLLFFLNPDRPISPAAVARGTAYYGLLFAVPSIAAHLLLARFVRAPIARLLPWTVTLVVAAGALGDWVHASVWTYFLPRGINVQLIKTALWLTLGAVILFYTALLHAMQRRPWGWRSRLLVIAVALGSVYAMFDRRTSFRPPATPPARWVALEPAEAPRLVVLSLPGATFDALLPLAEQGKLPAIGALLDAGVAARVTGFAPSRPEALEASWATGKYPWRHGISGEALYEARPLGAGRGLRLLPMSVGFSRWGLAGGRKLPLSEAERTALPLWEIVARGGRTVEVAGFRPALGASTLATEETPVLPLRAEQALAGSGWEPLAGWLGEDRRRLEALRRRLGGERPPDASFVALAGLEPAALATFGGFARAEIEGSRVGASRRAADALITYLSGLDAEIGAIWEAIPEPRLLVVSSPYGVAAPAGVSRLLRDLGGGDQRLRGTLSGPPDGILLARGAGFRQGVHLADVRGIDLAPTLLYAVGLPVARDFDGRVVAEAFEPALLGRRAFSFVPSFEGLPPVTSASPSR